MLVPMALFGLKHPLFEYNGGLNQVVFGNNRFVAVGKDPNNDLKIQYIDDILT
jgi:hypothetical protein